MLEEGRHFAKLAPNIVVKVAMSENGLEAISRFAEEGIKTNCTLIFTANQGLLAAKAGASLLSPFVGRLDDINQDGMIVIRELAEIFAIHEIDSEVLAASIRNPLPHDPGGAGRRAHRDAAVQGPPADGPPPADRQGHRPVQGGLGEGARGGGRQGLTLAATSVGARREAGRRSSRHAPDSPDGPIGAPPHQRPPSHAVGGTCVRPSVDGCRTRHPVTSPDRPRRLRISDARAARLPDGASPGPPVTPCRSSPVSNSTP